MPLNRRGGCIDASSVFYTFTFRLWTYTPIVVYSRDTNPGNMEYTPMAKRKPAKRKPAKQKQSAHRIDDALRRAVKESGLTVYRICKDADITTDSLYRFLEEERDLRFETAARIAEVLGLQLVPTAK